MASVGFEQEDHSRVVGRAALVAFEGPRHQGRHVQVAGDHGVGIAQAEGQRHLGGPRAAAGDASQEGSRLGPSDVEEGVYGAGLAGRRAQGRSALPVDPGAPPVFPGQGEPLPWTQGQAQAEGAGRRLTPRLHEPAVRGGGVPPGHTLLKDHAREGVEHPRRRGQVQAPAAPGQDAEAPAAGSEQRRLVVQAREPLGSGECPVGTGSKGACAKAGGNAP